jgi:hypothetical protein
MGRVFGVMDHCLIGRQWIDEFSTRSKGGVGIWRHLQIFLVTALGFCLGALTARFLCEAGVRNLGDLIRSAGG